MYIHLLSIWTIIQRDDENWGQGSRANRHPDAIRIGGFRSYRQGHGSMFPATGKPRAGGSRRDPDHYHWLGRAGRGARPALPLFVPSALTKLDLPGVSACPPFLPGAPSPSSSQELLAEACPEGSGSCLWMSRSPSVHS